MSQQPLDLQSERVQRQAQEAHASSPEGQAPRGRAVEVRVSSRARELQKAHELAEQVPDVRQDRVDQIRAAINAGTYQVSSEEIAQKLIASENW